MKPMKLKKLPSQKERKRYVFFRLHSSMKLEFNDVRNAITNSMLNWMGEEGFAKAKPWVIRNLWKGKEGVVQCSHRHADEVKVSLALIRQIGDAKVVFRTLRVSGTIKSGKDKLSFQARGREA
jgi:RNase P/RNase MRP subunit POP5